MDILYFISDTKFVKCYCFQLPFSPPSRTQLTWFAGAAAHKAHIAELVAPLIAAPSSYLLCLCGAVSGCLYGAQGLFVWLFMKAWLFKRESVLTFCEDRIIHLGSPRYI